MRRHLATATVLVSVALAGCGGDDSDDNAQVTVPVVDQTGGLVSPAAEATVYETYQGGHVQVDVARVDLSKESVPRLKAVLTYRSSGLDPEECIADMDGFMGRWGNDRATEYQFDCGSVIVIDVDKVTLLSTE